MMTSQDLLAKIESAMKAITRADLGQGILQPEKADQFIQVVQNATPLLNSARRLTMNSHTRHIDRIMFNGRVIEGLTETGAVTKESKPVTYLNQLVVKELGGYVGITDTTLEDNIEKENFENTIIQMIAEQVSRDLEELFLNGDTASSDPLLKVTDGWLKKAANKITGGTNFNATDVEDMFDKLILAVPPKYLRNRSDWRFYVPFEVEDDYRNKLKTRATNVGDSALTGSSTLAYKGIAIEYTPALPAGTVLLAPPNNLVYGIYRDIRIEPDRRPKERKTDFVVTLRADCHFEDENAAAVATGYTG